MQKILRTNPPEFKNKTQEKFFFELSSFDFYLGNIEDSIKRFKDIVIGPTGATGITIMFIDKHGYLWKVGERTARSFKIGEGVAGKAAKSKKMVFVRDVKRDTGYVVLAKSKNQGGIISIPVVKKDGRVLGVLNLTYKFKGMPSDMAGFRKTIKPIVKKLECNLENMISYGEAQKQVDKFEVTRAISKILDNRVSTHQKIETVVQKITRFLDVDKVAFYKADSKASGNFRLESESGSQGDLTETIFLEERLRKHRFVDLSKKLGFNPLRGAVEDKHVFTTIYMIFSKNKAIGLILIEDATKNTETFSEIEKDFLEDTAFRLQNYIRKDHSSKKIIEEKEKWRLIFQNDTNGILFITRDKKVIEANISAREMFGIGTKNIENDNFLSLIKVLDPEVKSPTLSSIENVQSFKTMSQNELLKKIDSFFSKGQKFAPKEYLIETKKGRFWAQISMRITIQKGYKEPFGVLNITDITKRKELEQNKDEFISIVSHELRTPLSAMKGFLSMIINRDYGSLNEKQARAVNRLKESNERMVDLVEDLLDVSRIEMGRLYLIKEPVNIVEITARLINDLLPQIQEKRLRVSLEGKPASYFLRRNSHESRQKYASYIIADRSRLSQIMLNLIDNAIKYSFSGGTIEIYFKEGKGFTEINVKDSGVGISKSDREILFQRFQRIQNPLTRKVVGSGLGLYITEKLVKAHKGTISVSSQKNKGATFKVKMPMAKQMPLMLGKEEA